MNSNDLIVRLKKVMEYLIKKDPYKFKTITSTAKHINIAQSNLSAALNGNERYLTSGTVQKFVDAFPELNYNWLMHGKGEMLKGVDNFLSHLPEPEPTINPSVEDLVNKAKSLKKSKSEPSSKVINEGDLVEAVEYIVPFKGQAGLASKQYPDEMVGELKKRVIKVKPEHRGVFYTIEADGNSMPPKILPGDWLRCEEISSLFWFEQNFFKKDKIYCIWDNERGILFKRIIYKDDGVWCVSDNQDKKTYPDFPLNFAQVNKILVVRKLVDRNF